MKRLSTTPISDVAKMPIKKGTLEFLQDSHKECTDSLVKAIVGSSYDPSKAYVLYGCIDSGVGDNHIITAGAIFFNGEVYLVDATTFTATSPNVPVLTIATTQFYTDADPVIFTDTTSHNVHDIRKIVIASGASGSGIANYADVIRVGSLANTQLAWYGNVNTNIPNIERVFGTATFSVSVTDPKQVVVNHNIGHTRYFVECFNIVYAFGETFDVEDRIYAIPSNLKTNSSFTLYRTAEDINFEMKVYTY